MGASDQIEAASIAAGLSEETPSRDSAAAPTSEDLDITEARPHLMLVSPVTPCTYAARARALWPRLDGRALSRCEEDPKRMARLISRRTSLSEEAILALLRVRGG